MTFYPKKQKIKDLFFHFYFLNMYILLNNELLVMKFCTDVKNIHMEGTVSQIFNRPRRGAAWPSGQGGITP